MKRKIFAILVILSGLFAFTGIANAEMVLGVRSFTIDSGTSISVQDIPIYGNIKAGYCYFPTMDSGDTVTIQLVQLYNIDSTPTSSTIAPLGWTDVEVGATEDNALKNLFSAEANLFCAGAQRITITTKTNQAADKACRLYFLVKR